MSKRFNAEVSYTIAQIESKLDEFWENDYRSNFRLHGFLKRMNKNPKMGILIEQHYLPLFEEIKLLKSKKDPDLNEGYSHLDARRITRFFNFVEMLVTDAKTYFDTEKKVRKQRKKKPISVEKKLQHFNYMKECSENQIASIEPSKILKSREVWVYDTKYRNLVVYRSENENGLDIYRSSIRGFSNTSIQKSIRKPDQILPEILQGTQAKVNRVMANVKAKEYVPNGRMNVSKVILRVFS